MAAATEQKPQVSKFPVPGEKSPLKTALADVLKKTEPQPTPKLEEKSMPEEKPKPQEKPVEKISEKSTGPKPFEVPEETLKALFKEK